MKASKPFSKRTNSAATNFAAAQQAGPLWPRVCRLSGARLASSSALSFDVRAALTCLKEVFGSRCDIRAPQDIRWKDEVANPDQQSMDFCVFDQQLAKRTTISNARIDVRRAHALVDE